MARLKPWYQVVTPREDLRDNRPLDASEFAVHLDHVRDGRAHADYVKPERFFERTYLTGSLLELSAEVVRRMSGVQVETSAVFNMATQFGGGKSHSLTALYHLGMHGERSHNWKGVDAILKRARVAAVPNAAVAVLVGTEFDVLTGRGGDGAPVRKTPWGEIAWQLGGEQSFAAVAEHDARGIAPGGDVIRQMLPEGPTLILLDELLNYMSRGRSSGLGSQLYNFVQNLGEEMRARTNAVLCVSVPSSVNIEMNADDRTDYEALKQLLNRLGKAVMMSVDQEIGEIIRRRLFEWSGMPDEGRKTVGAYAEWAIEHAQELTAIDAATVQQRFAAAYPFHPSLLSVFERKWSSLPRFQRTRGVLRLLALWIAHNYQEEHRKATGEPLLTLGLAPLQDLTFRRAMFEQLGGDDLEIPVTTDIIGKADAHAVRLDKEADDAVRKAQLHRKVATTIFFESNGGMSQSKAEASVPEIRTDVFGPDANMADLDGVLESLVGTCYYLNWDRNRYRYGLSPNLNQILVNRRGAVKPQAIEEKVRKQTEEIFNKSSRDLSSPLARATKEIARKYSPKRTNDVPNHPALVLVVLGLETPAGEQLTSDLMDSFLRDCGSSGRTFKSALIFAVPEAASSVREAAKTALAWEEINDDDETKARIDEGQKSLLARNLKNAQRDLDEAIFRTYRHVYLLGKDNRLREVDLGQITSSSAGSIVELILRELQRSEEITDGLSPNKLLKSWPQGVSEWSTKAVRDAFYSSPQLTRLMNPDSIKRTISDGVAQGLLGCASKDATGRLKLEKFKESLFEADIEIADEVFILKSEDAQKLREPPRLISLSIRPGQVEVKPGGQIAFSCSALDQYGQDFKNPEIRWSTSAGAVSRDGVYTVGATEGLHFVRAEAGEYEAKAEVRISAEPTPPPPPPSPGLQRLRWRGSVTPQKWMNFYMKVLTRFASSPDLKLEVSFEIPLDREQAKSKTEETRSGLKELGLDDNTTLT